MSFMRSAATRRRGATSVRALVVGAVLALLVPSGASAAVRSAVAEVSLDPTAQLSTRCSDVEGLELLWVFDNRGSFPAGDQGATVDFEVTTVNDRSTEVESKVVPAGSAWYAGTVLPEGTRSTVEVRAAGDLLASRTYDARCAQTFSDVGPQHPFFDEIQWLLSNQVTTGYTDGTFRPTAAVSRQAFAAYLYRYSHGGGTAPACETARFVDVPVEHPFCGEVSWLAGTGITGGYADGTFRPATPVSRQAMAAFLQRYRSTAGSTGATCDPTRFSDVSEGGFCADISWLADNDITTGYVDGTFRGAAPVTRQALSAYLLRYDTRFGPTVPPVG